MELPSGVSYAGFWKRFVAILLDNIILFVIYGVLVLFTTGNMGGIGQGYDFMYVVFTWLYFAGMESSQYKATLGKRILNIYVTDLEGNRISFLRATGRHFSKIISAAVFLIGYLMAGFTSRKQALHDMIASCLVLYEQEDTSW
ncbi:MAG: RDD family protein [Balneolales bacterium]